MKSHMTKFIELYQEMGIKVTSEVVTETVKNYPNAVYAIQLRPDDDNGLDPKYDSYGGFHSIIYFDVDGKFVYQGMWE